MDSLSRHVELHERLDGFSGTLIGAGNSLGAQKTNFLGSIPVELDRVGRLEAGSQKSAEGLHEVDSSCAVVIGTWSASAGWTALVDRVHVGTQDGDGSGGILAWEFGDDGRLDEGVGVE